MIVFRVDSSTQIGSGHLMRCLTLAGQLKKENQAEVAFISRDLEGNLNQLIKQNGYQLFLLPRVEPNNELLGYEKWLTVKPAYDAEQTKNILQEIDADYLVVDSYAIDKTWENLVRPYVNKIMVIDDLANRKHNCDILLDQNYYADMEKRYIGLVPSDCLLLLGPQYALLREEFYEVRKNLRIRDGNIRNVFVFFGGSDLTNETMKTLYALALLQRPDIQINVVVGASNKHKKVVETYCHQHENMHYYCQINKMAELMNAADLAVGAGGTTIWERCFLLLPAIVIAIAENQITASSFCGHENLIYYAGLANQITSQKIYEIVCSLFTNKDLYKTMINKMASIKYNRNKILDIIDLRRDSA